MTTWSAITWQTARAGGFAAYGLLTLSVAAGLILRNRWQSQRWPRLITNELHGYLSLLALCFIAVHVLAVWIDPFTHFGLRAVLVPFASGYRPIWMGLGIVALDAMLAVWISTRLRSRIGHAWWRRIHLLAFVTYAGATVHGLGTGSDTRTVWAGAIYGASVLLVGGLTARRLLVPAARTDRSRPGLAAACATAVGLGAVWALVGPLTPHWGARAATLPPAAASSAPAAVTRLAQGGAVSAPFTAAFTGRVSVEPANSAGLVTVRIDGALSGDTNDHLEILLHGLPLADGGVAMRASRVLMGTVTPLYRGEITALQGQRLVAVVRSPQGRLRLGVTLTITQDGRARGTVRGTAAPTGATA